MQRRQVISFLKSRLKTFKTYFFRKVLINTRDDLPSAPLKPRPSRRFINWNIIIVKRGCSYKASKAKNTSTALSWRYNPGNDVDIVTSGGKLFQVFPAAT